MTTLVVTRHLFLANKLRAHVLARPCATPQWSYERLALEYLLRSENHKDNGAFAKAKSCVNMAAICRNVAAKAAPSELDKKFNSPWSFAE